MKKILPFIVFIIGVQVYGQIRLDSNRVEKIKNSTVRIIIDNIPSGTGFIISDKTCEIITCWHVIASAFYIDNSNKQNLKKIEVEFRDGTKQEVGILTRLLKKLNKDAISYDFCLLLPTKKVKTKYSYLNIGSFNDIREGDFVYTCGYPLGIEQQIITTGILSTKWTDPVFYLTDTIVTDTIRRNVAWLDMTMNKGNSGGPVVLYDENGNDKVIGIATFILNPFAKHTQELSKATENSHIRANYGGIDLMKVIKLFSDAITYNSIGISGCIDLYHIQNAFGK